MPLLCIGSKRLMLCFESSSVAISRHEQQGQVFVQCCRQVPYKEVGSTRLVRVQTGILLKQGAIAMMMDGMEAIQRQGEKKRRLNVLRVRCKRRMQSSRQKR